MAKTNFTQRVGTVSGSDIGTSVRARATLRTTFRLCLELRFPRLLVDLVAGFFQLGNGHRIHLDGALFGGRSGSAISRQSHQQCQQRALEYGVPHFGLFLAGAQVRASALRD